MNDAQYINERSNFPGASNYERGYDFLYCIRSTVEVNDSLVDPHFKPVPSFATLSARGLAARDT